MARKFHGLASSGRPSGAGVPGRPSGAGVSGGAGVGAPLIVLSLFVYGWVMALLTVFKPFVAIGLLWGYKSGRVRVVSLVPFNDAMVGESFQSMLFGYGGNFIFFVPFGLLVYALLRGGGWRWSSGLSGLGGRGSGRAGVHRLRRGGRFPLLKTTLLGALCSIAIEITQYIFSLGYTDIDDILFNTLGAFIGAFIAKVAGPRANGLWVALAIAVAVVFLVLVILGPRI
ncbi:hypothetical protein H924_12620 [Corynebacterium callunae DSM 20147]|uniref:VanZ-like domain-containing protein n=1 Tax=Corynebacterium callunae DSM 20147 TaxID=1121353 RepID=M1UHS4_9CORY|nr:hypothetical protein H924_12620 [Corynebacterium callunae DSM 20147]